MPDKVRFSDGAIYDAMMGRGAAPSGKSFSTGGRGLKVRVHASFVPEREDAVVATVRANRIWGRVRM